MWAVAPYAGSAFYDCNALRHVTLHSFALVNSVWVLTADVIATMTSVWGSQPPRRQRVTVYNLRRGDLCRQVVMDYYTLRRAGYSIESES